ncbi:hypothetical protein FOL47_011061 [Perkinsus chesapeaki]|uniref:Multifunctional fusion protein n=1 Tax=Perkinsus chesapeaki TaxID=330153 RepID=A0A7J6MNA0_PERCH|nr:hypothetical protein FOL47_011061 [Perkinsus chesapeaki]
MNRLLAVSSMVSSSISALTTAAVKGGAAMASAAAAPPMKVSTCEQMRRCDKGATDKYSIPSALLMENAGITSYRCLTELLPDHQVTPQTKVLVVCGPGNNGGDGFVVARYVHSNGGQARVILLNGREKYHGDANTNLNIVDCIPGIPVEIATTEEAITAAVDWAEVLVDGIFGTGLGRPVDPSSPFGIAIAAINRARKPVMSLDIPSGINGDSGRIMGPQAVHATSTATFGLVKVGNLVYPGREMCGDLTVTHIGYPPELYADLDTYVNYFPPLPERNPAGHKGSFGKALFLSGAEGYYGAPMLSSNSFLKAGGGYSRLATVKEVIPVIAAEAPSVVFHQLESTDIGSICSGNYNRVFSLAQEMSDMLVLGPGMSTNGDTARLVRQLVLTLDKPLVIDGDGITAISIPPVDSTDIFTSATQLLQERHRKGLPPVVLTPHLAELSRLTGITMKELTDGSHSLLEVGRQLAQDTNSVVVVKVATSMVCEPSGRVRMNLSGNSGMGTAGSGDVLSGIIPAMYSAYGHDVSSLGDAVAAAVFVHGVAGDIAAIRLGGEDGLTAPDIMNAVPEAVSYTRGGEAFKKYAPQLENVRDSVDGMEQPRDQPPPLLALSPAKPSSTEEEEKELPPSLVAVDRRIKEVTEEICRLERERSLGVRLPAEELAMAKVEITKPLPMRSLSEADLVIRRAKKAQPDEKVVAKKALLQRIEQEVGEEINRQRSEELEKGIELRARYTGKSKLWEIAVPRLRDEQWNEPGPIRRQMEEELTVVEFQMFNEGIIESSCQWRTKDEAGQNRNEVHTAILLLMGKPHSNQSYQEVCRHALLGVLSGVISVTTSALPGRDGSSNGGAVYATVITRRALTEGYKKSLVRALAPHGLQALVLSVDCLKNLVLSQGGPMEGERGGGGAVGSKKKKKGKRGKRGKNRKAKPLPYITEAPRAPEGKDGEVEEDCSEENIPALANIEMEPPVDGPIEECPSETALDACPSPPLKEATSSSHCDHFYISTPSDSEATGPGLEAVDDDDDDDEEDELVDAVGTWLGVDSFDGEQHEDGEYLDQHGSPRARNAAAAMTFFNSAATAFGFSRALGLHEKFAGVVDIVDDNARDGGLNTGRLDPRRQKSEDPAMLGGCELTNLRESDKNRVATLVATLAQQKRRADAEEKARAKAESSAEKAIAEAEKAKETLRRSLQLLNKYHQRAKADLAERARLKACVAMGASGNPRGTSQSQLDRIGQQDTEKPEPPIEPAVTSHAPTGDTSPLTRRTSEASAGHQPTRRRFSEIRPPQTLTGNSPGVSSSDDEVLPEEACCSKTPVAGGSKDGPLNKHQRSLLRRYLQISRDSETVAVLRKFVSNSVEERRPKANGPTPPVETNKATRQPGADELENSAVMRSSISITAHKDGKRVFRLRSPPRFERTEGSSPRINLVDAPKSPERYHKPRSPLTTLTMSPEEKLLSPALGRAEKDSLDIFLRLNKSMGDRLPEAPLPRPGSRQSAPVVDKAENTNNDTSVNLAEVDDVLSALSFADSYSSSHPRMPLVSEHLRYRGMV